MESKCSVGEYLGDSDSCHKTIYCKTCGLINISTLTIENRALLQIRTEATFGINSTICLHHKAVFITRYETLQKQCCDPFKQHGVRITKALRTVDIETAKQLKIKPGQKICVSCRKKAIEQESPDLESASDEEFEPSSAVAHNLNTSITTLGCSPLKPVGDRDKLGYGKRKISQVEQIVKSKLSKVLKIPITDLHEKTTPVCTTTSSDLETLMTLIKKKYEVSSKQKKLQLLTLAPESWTIKKTSEEFGATEYLVRKARELRNIHGILPEPQVKAGKPLSTETIKLVVDFYQSDEYSRICPGQKDFVSVRTNSGTREQKQKRLLLINLKELYLEFIKEHKVKIGFSTFCTLRPQHCVLVDSKSAHSVCVCEQHQNVVLLLSVLPEQHTAQDLMSKIVCCLTARDCMLHQCENCPGKMSLKVYLKELFEKNDMDDDDEVKYKQWVHTDRTTLVDLQASTYSFIDSLCDACEKLCSHHFITKSQAQYLKEAKNTLEMDTAIILLDFAENYSFIVQDAVQGNHWDNSQVTLHPFAIYYKDGDEVKCLSFCALSDCLKHDTVAVHAFLNSLLQILKENFPQLRKIKYFSDGAASQYKNCKNLINLVYHDTDFAISAEWHFFATSHGKSPCDGIGGTVKRLVARASLQATTSNQILNPHQMFKWATANISGIRFFFMSSADIQENAKSHNLESRFSSIKTIPGTRSHHSFITKGHNSIEMRRLSADDNGTTIVLTDHVVEDLAKYQPGKYTACLYDNNWYIGNIVERNEEEQDVLINFMKRTGSSLSWPSTEDKCWVPMHDLLCIVQAPTIQAHSGRQYKLALDDFERIKVLSQPRIT